LNEVPHNTRGFYVLYDRVRPKKGRVRQAAVTYIGISGLGKGSAGIRSRLRSHNRKKDDWSHFSFFEVHDNITADEIRELEALLLQIFQHDPRVNLSNVQTGSSRFRKVRRRALWPELARNPALPPRRARGGSRPRV
jgi:hypothetical protein